MGRLKQLLQDLNITYNERRFETEDGVDSLDPPFVSVCINLVAMLTYNKLVMT